MVGGDLDAQPGFKDRFLNGEPYDAGYVRCPNGQIPRTETDLTVPIAWALDCPMPKLPKAEGELT